MINLGFIGCGGIANHHAKTISKSVDGIRIAAGADKSAAVLESFGVEFDASTYRDYREMLTEADIDAVCVALPTHLHHDAVVAAAAEGKQIFCEKPMARSLADCDDMIEACEKSGSVLMIGHVRRFDSDWDTWREVVSSGELGSPVLWRQSAGGPAPKPSWFMHDEKGGGPFLDGCVHNWDFTNLVFGEPEVATGRLLRIAETSAYDTGSVTVRYKNDNSVVLNWSWGLPDGVRAGNMSDIIGPEGVLLFPGSFPDSDIPKSFDRTSKGCYLLVRRGEKRIVEFPKEDMFALEWIDFRDAIIEKRAPGVTGVDGRNAVAVALATLEAGRTGETVKIGVTA